MYMYTMLKHTQYQLTTAYTSPDSPVSQLELFISLHTAAVLKQKGQGVLGQVENTAGLPRVKHVDNVESKVSL